jgi:molybdopterin molybdotransferase
MDGFAVRVADLELATRSHPVRLNVIGESRAGLPTSETIGAGQAVAISTGAVIPAGADAVVPIEDTVRVPGGEVQVLAAPAEGAWVRRAGDDVLAGSKVLPRGTRVGPAELGVLGSLGHQRVRCAQRPRVSVLVTGDELLRADEEMHPGGVRDTNTLTISALVGVAGGEIVHTASLADDLAATATGIAAAIEPADVAIICGGVSVGAHDHVRQALASLAATELFWGVALKPGRPTWFGTQGETLIFGLPGNPVSAMVTFVLLAAPALRVMLGAVEPDLRTTAILDSDYAKAPGRTHAVRCRLTAAADGLHATPTGAQGSHVLTSMLGADALAMIPTESGDVPAGERVVVEPLGPTLLGSRW